MCGNWEHGRAAARRTALQLPCATRAGPIEGGKKKLKTHVGVIYLDSGGLSIQILGDWVYRLDLSKINSGLLDKLVVRI